jgi:hypothetical protein
MRMSFFGPDGDTSWNLKRLRDICNHFENHELDCRGRDRILALVKQLQPSLLIHLRIAGLDFTNFATVSLLVALNATPQHERPPS